MRRLCLKDILSINDVFESKVKELNEFFLVESENELWYTRKDCSTIEPEFERAYGFMIDSYYAEELSESDVIALSEDVERAQIIEDDMDSTYVDDDIYADYSTSEQYVSKHYEEGDLLNGLPSLNIKF